MKIRRFLACAPCVTQFASYSTRYAVPNLLCHRAVDCGTVGSNGRRFLLYWCMWPQDYLAGHQVIITFQFAFTYAAPMPRNMITERTMATRKHNIVLYCRLIWILKCVEATSVSRLASGMNVMSPKWRSREWTNLKSRFCSCCDKYSAKLSLLADTNSDFTFQLKLAIGQFQVFLSAMCPEYNAIKYPTRLVTCWNKNIMFIFTSKFCSYMTH
jgi:hypothetical protein